MSVCVRLHECVWEPQGSAPGLSHAGSETSFLKARERERKGREGGRDGGGEEGPERGVLFAQRSAPCLCSLRFSLPSSLFSPLRTPGAGREKM